MQFDCLQYLTYPKPLTFLGFFEVHILNFGVHFVESVDPLSGICPPREYAFCMTRFLTPLPRVYRRKHGVELRKM